MSRLKRITGCLVLTLGALVRVCGQNPELIVQTGHTRSIDAVAFSSDGRLIATASSDETVKLWDVMTGKQIISLTAHGFGTIKALAFSPDNKFLASGGDDQKIKLWRVEDGGEVGVFKGHTHYVRCVAFSPDGKILASGGLDKKIRLWDVATQQPIRVLDEDKYLYSIAYSPDGKKIASSGEGRDSKIWDLETGRPVVTLSRSDLWSDRITSLAFSPDGKIVATGNLDKTVRLWDAATGVVTKTLPEIGGEVLTVAYSPDGKVIASADTGGKLYLWNAKDGSELKHLDAHNGRVNSVAFGLNSTILASAGSDMKVKLWDIETGREVRTFASHAGIVVSTAISPDSRLLAQAGDDQTIKIWELTTGKLLNTLTSSAARVVSVAFSPDGKFLASGCVSLEGASDMVPIRLYEVETGREVRTFNGHAISVNSLAFSPDGRVLASASNDRTVKLWDVSTGKELNTLQGYSNPVYSVAFSPDGKMLATGSFDKSIKIWNVETGQIAHTLPGHDDSVRAVAFSPNGRLLASGGNDRMVRVWDIATEKELVSSLRHTNNILTLAFRPDGKVIASSGLDKTIKVWETETGKELATLTGHSNTIYSLRYSADGKILVSGSGDAVVKIWDAVTNKNVMSLIAIDDRDYLLVTPDNFYRASRGAFAGVAFRANGRIFPFEQFDLRLNRPDLILERLGYSTPELIETYRKAVQKRLKLLNFTPEMLGNDYHLPELAINTATLPTSTTNRNIRFKVLATDSEYSLARLNVYVNDVPIYGSAGTDISEPQTRRLERFVDLELSQGNNKIEVSVLNEKGVESLRQTFNINYTVASPRPTLYVLAIGVSKYADSAYNLNYADKDASDLISFFQSQKERFSEVKVLPLLNAQATKKNILEARAFLMQSKVDDEVVLFLAGHGMLDEKLDYYFGTTDIDFGRPAERGLSYEAIEGMLDGVAARQKLLLMDTCHAGEVDKDETRLVSGTEPTVNSDGVVNGKGVKAQGFPRASVAGARAIGLGNSYELLQELFADLRRGSGATVISAASGVKYAYEADGNGVFTHAVLEGLKGKADRNGDHVIRVSELQDYVVKLVEELTEGNQKPTSRRENLENDFALY